MQSKIEIKLVDTNLPSKCDHEILPNYATSGSAGLDLRSGEGYILKPGESHSFHTGLAIFLNDPMFCGLLVPRSSLGIKKIHLTNTLGIIDSDYHRS
jgi:dUTP pyrophosphatase